MKVKIEFKEKYDQMVALGMLKSEFVNATNVDLNFKNK